MTTTTLYEKLFIDGFEKPSYVVATVLLERAPDATAIEAAARRTLALHPRLRSMVRMRFGVPFELVPRPWAGVLVHEAADLRALEERLLSTPLDFRRESPLEVHVVADPAALVLKIHHAVIDASSGFAVLQDFAQALAGNGPVPRTPRPSSSSSRMRRARDWLGKVQLRPRLPESGVVASFRPMTPLERAPVVYVERLLPNAHARIARSARARGATFSELVASSLLSAMAAYNEARVAEPPASVGLMFARARPRSRSADAGFRADTAVIAVPRDRLERPHHPETLAELRRRANERRHNDVALAALYAKRKILGRPAAPAEETSISFTLSDLTAFGRGRAALPMTGIRVLASPTSFDHGGMLVSRFGDDVRFSIVTHRDAVDARALLDSTLDHLESS
jgi:hypothetical protein